MSVTEIPSTVVVCAAATDRAGRQEPGHGHVPITWVVGLDAIARVPASACVALDVPPAAFATRQSLRDLVHAALRCRPDLRAIHAEGATVQHRGILAEAGIRVALVDAYSDPERGSRRPAPAGWACRSMIWGLWEVQLTAETGGWRRVLAGSPWPAPRPGGLAVVQGSGSATGAATIAQCIAWAARAHARRGAVLATLPELVATLEQGGTMEAVGGRGSVLHAA